VCECESFQGSSYCLRTELDICDLSIYTSDKNIKEKILFEHLVDLCKVVVNMTVFWSILEMKKNMLSLLLSA